MDDTLMKVGLDGTIIEDQHKFTSVSQKIDKGIHFRGADPMDAGRPNGSFGGSVAQCSTG